MKDDSLSDTVGTFDSSDKNLGQTKKGYALDNVYAKEVWNAAIEAAALIVQPKPHIEEERECKDIVEQIRKLKK